MVYKHSSASIASLIFERFHPKTGRSYLEISLAGLDEQFALQID